MESLPASVASELHRVLFADRAMAFLRIDEALRLAGAGGDLAAFGLAPLRAGALAADALPLLEGLLPLDEEPYLLPAVELAPDRVADLHFHRAEGALWLILLDATRERDAARRLQQKAYDMTLLQEREALLNHRLEATNAALMATQRDLEASRDALLAAHRQVQAQAEELVRWNKTLEERVASQLKEIERVGRLKRFLAPSIAELIVSSGEDRILASHRRDIAALFCDLRGFTAFAESAEPEEVMELLHGYHAALGPLIQSFEGTLERFVGDGLMVFFNDPLPCPNAAERAVRLAIAMRSAAANLATTWRRRGHQIGFGVGIAQGFATLGQIGFEGRFDYAAIGTVVNTAARLSAVATDGQILVTSRVALAVAEIAELSERGALALKGLSRPLAIANVEGLKLGDCRQVG